MSDRNTGKLYYLRDRGRRSSAAQKKRQDTSRKAPEDGRKPSAQETVWLGRALWGVAAYLAAYWLSIVTGVISFEGNGELQKWAYSLLLADLFVAVVGAIGGYELSRDERRDLFALVAAGALISISLARIAHTFTSTVERNLLPGERLEVSAIAACLCVGIWVVSHALRARAAER